MKKNQSNNENKPFKLFNSKKNEEFIIESNSEKRKIRHIEDAASFLNETNNIEGDYGEAQDMMDLWSLDEKSATVKRKRRNRYIRIVVAFAVTVIFIFAVFYLLPRVLPEFFKGTNIELFVERDVHLEYDDSYRVVNKSSESLMTSPDPASKCITQVLYNEPVLMVEENVSNGYSLVTTLDGITGYVKNSALVTGTDSVEPDLHEYKLIVSDVSKNVMTHASQGTLIARVNMNTVLYADVKRDGVYQVSLPNGQSGWIGSSGVIEIGPRDQIEEVSSRYFVSSAISLVNSVYRENGLTMNGLSMNGLVYVCSCVNGIPMPRTMDAQMNMGTEVKLEYDVVSGDLIVESIIPGDILFLSSPYGDNPNKVYEIALCTGTGTLLMVSDARTTIKLVNFNANSDIGERILTVRRVFSE
ncbi:MAG: SH3 domain-containing protein [Saccharofermentans sp.]|nr:SH3 domain-containing protein [Saccharofermentans sp.]